MACMGRGIHSQEVQGVNCRRTETKEIGRKQIDRQSQKTQHREDEREIETEGRRVRER